MSSTQLRLPLILLLFSLISLYPAATPQPAYAASANLVWKPYLQQLTDTSLIILWSTQTGANPVIRYSVDTSYSSSAQGSSRTAAFGVKSHRVELSGLQQYDLHLAADGYPNNYRYSHKWLGHSD